MNPTKSFCFSALTLAVTMSALAQAPKVEFPMPSPTCTIKQRVGVTDVEIVYSRPSLRDRTIFGGLIPYGSVWRTGANASTKISFSTDVKLNGQPVPAGKYALYTIPGEKEWTVIIYKNTNLGSVAQYDKKDDVARITAEPKPLGRVETFTIDFMDIKDDSAELVLLWENTLVPISIETDIVQKLPGQIEAAMKGEGPKPYYQAAMFYLDHGLDIDKAKQWIDAAAAQQETFYILHVKAKIQAKLGDKQGAIATAKHSKELAIKAEGPNSGYVKQNDDLISSLQ